MIIYSPAKINLGLHIVKKRPDGFHEISTLLLPLPFFDILEIVISRKSSQPFIFSNSGLSIPVKIEDNLCYRAWDTFCRNKKPVDVTIHLHKQIPPGSGLGGGSSNASSVLKGLNTLTGETLNSETLERLAAELGSDCPFFIENNPKIAFGRGEILHPANIDLKGYYILLLNPGTNINTGWAYANSKPLEGRTDIGELTSQPIISWKEILNNDFEEVIHPYHPEIASLKNSLYNDGAIYASMSGSGSTVYGIFGHKPVLRKEIEKYVIWEGKI